MPNQTLKKHRLIRQATNQISPQIRFDPKDHCPLCCYKRCRHYDGKRCSLTGNEPEQLCRPACAKLIKALMLLESIVLGGEKS